MFGFLKKIFGTAQDRLLKKYKKIVVKINEWEEKFQSLTDEELIAKTEQFRKRYSEGESLDSLLPEAYAVVKNACRRFLGKDVHVSGYDQKWDMVPYDVQLLGGIAMHYGAIAEMQTGEGKTLTAALPLYLNAITKKPVHLVTVNDYLAERDCQWIGSLLRYLGLTTGALTNDVPLENRKEIYLADVVYGTASEFGFDYLRDNSMAVSKDQQVQRGYYFAIIDEVDSILIDEARTPLIISGPVAVSKQLYAKLKEGAEDLVKIQRDYCNRLATEAKKQFENANSLQDLKKQQKEKEEAFKKFWLVSKGTPHNKILKRLKEDPDMRAALDGWDLYYYADQNKEEKQKTLANLFIIVEEKMNEFELTDKGIAAWDKSGKADASSLDFVMFDISDEYLKIDENLDLSPEEKMEKKLTIQQKDAERKERAHNLRQLLRAHLLMEKDIDYIVDQEKIIIIDEHTGRPQPGRRFSDGLHQAIEAKEDVEIQKETQTYATITLQNYFRMYGKISGMTGTAMTEANEFKEIYKIDVLSIPTHKSCKRTDNNDEIYMTEREKYNAILKDVKEVHAAGRPILIGTESVEVSEKLSRIFKQNNLPHTVLNAKNHAREAEIIAYAGKKGAITIATNMAGRGTDIKLEEGIAPIGGLYVLGTTRHQSRRIDRQLRGRCARQGDPGSSRFYVSFEDSLLRLFASSRITSVLQKFRPPEGEPISAKMLNRSIETAQKRVEQRNYMIRKHTLEYDDVMNKQRQEIYSFRNELLHAENVRPIVEEIFFSLIALGSEKFLKNHAETGGLDTEGFRLWLMEHFPVSFKEGFFEDDYLEQDAIENKAFDEAMKAFDKKMEIENAKIPVMDFPGAQPVKNPADVLAKNLMIRRLDQLWQEHLHHMDHLRSDVNLRSVGQRDPLMEFKEESFSLFEKLYTGIRTEIARDLFKFRVLSVEELSEMRANFQKNNVKLEHNHSLAEEIEYNSLADAEDASYEDDESSEKRPEEKPRPIVLKEAKVGRNDPCPCGSGKKYKKCCGIQQEEKVVQN